MKLSDLSDEEWFARLTRRRMEQQQTIKSWWQYYDGDQPLYYVAKILKEQEDRFPALVINWCEKFIDSIDRRCNVEGFRIRGSDTVNEKLWEIWLRNDLHEFQSENNIASLVTGISYMVVGPSDEGALITVESPDSMAIEIDPRTRRTMASLKVWKSDPEQALEDMAVLHLPNADGVGSRLVEFENGEPVGEKHQQWMKTAQRLQSSPEIPVVRFLNRQRQRKGRSELRTLKPLVDATNQVATNMLAGVEHHAVPRKWGLGLRKEDFTDEDGNQVPAWKIATGAVWLNQFDEDNPDATPQVGQFSQSDLRNFHETISLLGRIGAGLCDMAPHTFGFGVSDNPASADGIRASQDDFVTRVERAQVSRGTAYGRVMRLASAVEANDPAKITQLETIWRDAATPTRGAQADAAAKTYSSGISDLHQARMDYGYSVTTIRNMEEREAEQVDAAEQRIMRAASPGAGDAAGGDDAAGTTVDA